QFFLQAQGVHKGLAFSDTQQILTANHIGHPGPSTNSFTLQQAAKVEPIWPAQRLPNVFAGPNVVTSPFRAYKFEYSQNINPTTFGTLRFYRTFSDQSESLP